MANERCAGQRMIILEVVGQEALEVALVEAHHLIQAFPLDAPDQALGNRILPRAPRGGEDLLDAQVHDAPLRSLNLNPA